MAIRFWVGGIPERLKTRRESAPTPERCQQGGSCPEYRLQLLFPWIDHQGPGSGHVFDVAGGDCPPVGQGGGGDQCVRWVDAGACGLERLVDGQVGSRFRFTDRRDAVAVFVPHRSESSGIARLASGIRGGGHAGLDLGHSDHTQEAVGRAVDLDQVRTRGSGVARVVSSATTLVSNR